MLDRVESQSSRSQDDAATPATASWARSSHRLETAWARHLDDVREAQRLRYRVFALEMGARLVVPPGTPPGLDVDRFDDFCEHVLVRAVPLSDGVPEVVGTYRVLTPSAARRAGGYYSETEFDLQQLAGMRPRMAELGRSCIHPAWRTGGAILALWGALGEFLSSRRLEVAFGCASVDLRDGGHRAASLWRRLSERHCASEPWRVSPLKPLPLASLRDDLDVATPPLIKGYLRCGAELLGLPAWDTAFQTADLPMLLTLDALPQPHRRRFLGAGSGH
ncbi:GNAT family N-acetyltransferase [Variovorax gracilis]